MIRTKLYRKRLVGHLRRRYKQTVAERVVANFPELSIPMDYDSFVELMEKLINFDTDRLMKIAFDVYNYN